MTCVLMVFCTFGYIWDDSFFGFFHFRLALAMGEEVGVTFPGSWGA